ncbi:hypothetical protein WJX81_007583 [Elliptochloris bilobata]|uniref:non-specific serine/threonine protein kinase n=1 Tax=Elliptochloris bilobata TaxID=381761 RepID=A0AAW1QLM6_9CHLO
MGRTLGEGTYAKVKYGQHVETGEVVAIKVLDRGRLREDNMLQQIKREIAILRDLHHPNVVDLKEVMGSRDKIYMVLEFCPGGELFDKIVAEGPMDEDVARKVFQQMLDGLDYCHRRSIYHRDLKPENVLLDGAGAVKLSDFGLGALPDSARADGMLKTACGTPNYVAPEVLQRVGYAGAPADIWSLGVCLYIITTGTLPFDEPNLPVMFDKISRADYPPAPWWSPELAHLIHHILMPDPLQRPTADELREHPWVAVDYTPVLETASTLGSPHSSRSGFGGVGAQLPPPPTAGGGKTALADGRPVSDIFAPTVAARPLSEEEQSCVAGQAGSEAPTVHHAQRLNAFQLINAALDISALFDARTDVVARMTRFTSRALPCALLSRVEESAQALGGRTRRRDDTRVRVSVPGPHGSVVLGVEVLPVVAGVHMVDVQRITGDSPDFYDIYVQLIARLEPLISGHKLPRLPSGGLARVSSGRSSGRPTPPASVAAS